jgi:hypothetical protein
VHWGIFLVFTCKTTEHAEIYEMCRNYRSVKVINGYIHDDLKYILDGCNLGLVPVLWEDNLPQIAIEMASYGVPVLASSAGGATELCGSELFKFECGNAEDFLAKLTHFIDEPQDLAEYWEHHTGLVTLHEHLAELISIYGIDYSPVTLSLTELSFLMLENEFLHKHISLNEDKFVVNPILDELRRKVWEADEREQQLKNEIEGYKAMENRSGRVTFLTTYEPIQGYVGADMFKIELGKFNYADFYAEIKFVHLFNVSSSVSDLLRVSGTWHNETGAFELHLHQLEWEKNISEVTKWVWYYIRENVLCFFARYAGQYCGIAYDVLTLITRNTHELPKLVGNMSRDITRNELRPEDAFNTLAELIAVIAPTAIKEPVETAETEENTVASLPEAEKETANDEQEV